MNANQKLAIFFFFLSRFAVKKFESGIKYRVSSSCSLVYLVYKSISTAFILFLMFLNKFIFLVLCIFFSHLCCLLLIMFFFISKYKHPIYKRCKIFACLFIHVFFRIIYYPSILAAATVFFLRKKYGFYIFLFI